ncbi:ligase-associated DNA damage response endonuclease PdeM [Hyunsoonleella flava]|uniref:Ligase-associated DNA damage response endonuclease PdeM n=1 Tax=Hyunsoonleella flava TaxID=2527939 RepID=A0A4Q9FIA1_9FLAO|nr:ligase-associated DNA damage response endonuclease PdeM [Hyunsoonleella flava]TBN06731.1 ligase-associated DNA damage response endonuclease PdeM [Hyunsoonleella flava]
MTIAAKTVNIQGEVLALTNQRCIYWKAKEALILSDLHIGKTAHFRKNGIPVSSEVLQKDLQRLEQLIHHFNPKSLIIVGDLFHAELNKDVLFFKKWMQQFPDINISLIKGNHDKNSFELYDGLNIDLLDNQLELPPFVFVHDIKTYAVNKFYISGHIHPGVLIKGKGKQRIKLPCYQIIKNKLVLPAFSEFTGLNSNTNIEITRCFAITKTQVFEV